MLQAALNEVSVATQEDIRQVDILSDQNLNSTFEKAKDLMETLAALEKMKSAIMLLKQPTISEIRSYSQPPAAIEMVMQATLVLLGEDKKKIKVCYILSLDFVVSYVAFCVASYLLRACYFFSNHSQLINELDEDIL